MKLELKTPGFSVVVPALREEDDSAAEGAARLAGKEPEGRLSYSCRESQRKTPEFPKEPLRMTMGAECWTHRMVLASSLASSGPCLYDRLSPPPSRVTFSAPALEFVVLFVLLPC